MRAARQALAQAQPRRALMLLLQHRQQYPEGQFTEERQALEISALMRTGDPDGARRAALDFRRRYPKSLFSPVVEQALRR